MATISLESVSKCFNGVDVVRDVSLDIEDGEFVVLVGPSGCGKTTTLRMIAGLETVSEGTIRFNGGAVNDLSPRQRNIAMVFQNYALYPHMTVARNMTFALKNNGMSKAEIDATVQRAADLLNICELLDRKPKALSGGQQQRVAMGRAIVRRPEVFLFDEPLSNLDSALRTQMRIEIKKLHQLLRTTVVYVTHDQIEAMTLADRIVVMDKGEIVQVGIPMEVYERPRTRFVASFIGSPRMNFIKCTVHKNGTDSLYLKFGNESQWPIPAAHSARFRKFENAAFEIAVRPEHVSENGAGSNVAQFDAAPTVVELTGADTIVVFSLSGTDVSARCRPDWRIKAGQPMRFGVSFDHLYTIDAASGVVGQPH